MGAQTPKNPGQALEAWREEMGSAWLYRVVAQCEVGTPRAALFLELAKAAEDQAQMWVAVMQQRGEPHGELVAMQLARETLPADTHPIRRQLLERRIAEKIDAIHDEHPAEVA